VIQDERIRRHLLHYWLEYQQALQKSEHYVGYLEGLSEALGVLGRLVDVDAVHGVLLLRPIDPSSFPNALSHTPSGSVEPVESSS
jgi:hypothetical protein